MRQRVPGRPIGETDAPGESPDQVPYQTEEREVESEMFHSGPLRIPVKVASECR